MTSDVNATFKDLIINIVYLSLLIIAVIISKAIIDYALPESIWHDDTGHIVDLTFVIRVICSAVVAFLLFLIFIFNNPIPNPIPLTEKPPKSQSFWPWNTISRRSRQIGLSIVLISSVGFLITLYVEPLVFRDLSSDEKQVENLSAFFSFIASVIFVLIGFRLRKLENSDLTYKYYPLISWCFAGVFFLICMEEVSWMQGMLSFETPDFFMDNHQNETNIHNYATHIFERAYYFSTFIFFILIPFFYERRSTLSRTPLIKHFLPSRYMIYIGAMALAYNFGTLISVNFLVSFFITLYILVYYTWIKKVDDHLILSSLLIAVFVTSQVAFVFLGHSVQRSSAFLEYKEFFIPLTFLFYAIEILARSKKLLLSLNS